MRIAGEWMAAPDPYILEYLDEEGLSSPKQIEDDGRIPYGRTYINKRLNALSEHRFAVHKGNGMYGITDRGRAWLAGEFDARELDDADTDAGNGETAAV